MKRQLYRMHDVKQDGVHLVSDEDEALRWNDRGYGIFWTVNEFNGARRIDNLTRLLSWAIDLDSGTKEDQLRRIGGELIDDLPTKPPPSLVIESKNGFHVYWNAYPGTSTEQHAEIMAGLVEHYGADPNAKDIARILRAPGFRHLKDPHDPFEVRVVLDRPDRAYSADSMQMAFRSERTERERVARSRMRADSHERRFLGSEGFWDRVFEIDARDALQRLSGHAAVSGEIFELRTQRSGNCNIRVNGKGTSCWVDTDGKIGSHDKGGPSVYQWLRWYGNSPAECAAVIKELFPEIAEDGD